MRLCAALVGVLAAGIVAVACSDIDEVAEYRDLAEEVADSNRVWRLGPPEVDEIVRVLASNGQDEVEIIRGARSWIPGEGASVTAAALMFDVEQIIGPVLAYRQLDVDSSSREFGLVDSDLALVIESANGDQWELHFGGPTPSGYGYYVVSTDDPFVYTVIPQLFDGVTSLLSGEKTVRPPDPRFLEALENLADPEQIEEEVNPWLAQVLEYERGQNEGVAR